VFVDDGSTDGTGEVLQRVLDSAPKQVVVLTMPANRGKGEAVRHGMLRALADGAPYVGFWDADLATPLEAIPSFCRILDSRPEIAAVIGARVQLLGRRIERRALRHYLGRVFATAVSLMLQQRVYDTQCGAKIFRATAELRQILSTPFRSRWVFDVEMLARIARETESARRQVLADIVYELPLTEWRDVGGSKLRLRDFPTAVADIARIWLSMRSERVPSDSERQGVDTELRQRRLPTD
jgi:glycosyltransferase involved in cell wall biosynthesis